ncbi:MAG: hypothetical protein JWO85_2564 [Candidatus Eremiobacteraeota bacterium]|nr:hypothetical protein [Candidatus Eremiobacteraeota bacterium]
MPLSTDNAGTLAGILAALKYAGADDRRIVLDEARRLLVGEPPVDRAPEAERADGAAPTDGAIQRYVVEQTIRSIAQIAKPDVIAAEISTRYATLKTSVKITLQGVPKGVSGLLWTIRDGRNAETPVAETAVKTDPSIEFSAEQNATLYTTFVAYVWPWGFIGPAAPLAAR